MSMQTSERPRMLWSKTDLAYLEYLKASGRPVWEIARKLDRSPQAVETRARYQRQGRRVGSKFGPRPRGA